MPMSYLNFLFTRLQEISIIKVDPVLCILVPRPEGDREVQRNLIFEVLTVDGQV